MNEKTQIEIGGAAPCLIVRDVPETLAFYRDRLGFEVTYQGPEPDDIFFGIVQRGRAMLMFKTVGVEPVANHTRDVGQGEMRWDTYIYVPDPDALAAEFASGNVTFSRPLADTHDGLRGFEIEDVNSYLLFFGRPKE
jgi:catechol 2,3-dioxygenase-like lactoylglutathione lyase family enzyme